MSGEERLIKYLQAVTLEILAIVAKSDMADPAAKIRALRQIDAILDQFGRTVEDILPESVIRSYYDGVQEANERLMGAGVGLTHTEVMTAEGKISQPFQKAIHLDAVQLVVNDTMLDMTAAIATARVSAGVAIDRALDRVNQDIATGFIRGDARRTTTIRVMDTFLKEGMTSFITKDGKKLPLNFYASTVVRTKTREASVQGSINRYRDTGQDLMQVVGNGDSCKICSAYKGMIFSLDGKTPGYPIAGQSDTPPFHPNCRCGGSPYVIEYKTAEEINEGLQRNSEFDPQADRRTPAQKAAYENEQRLRRAANAEMKQFMRWQERLGADAPKTLGAFKRMKRQNTIKFQELQSNYRSVSMTKGR